MKGFFKFLMIASTFLAAVVGFMVIADRCFNKNRISGSYLICDLPKKEDE